MKRTYEHQVLCIRNLLVNYVQMRERVDALDDELERFHKRIVRMAQLLAAQRRA